MVKGSFENRGIIYNIRSGYSETLKSCKEGIDLLDIYELIKIEEHRENKNNSLLEDMAYSFGSSAAWWWFPYFHPIYALKNIIS